MPKGLAISILSKKPLEERVMDGDDPVDPLDPLEIPVRDFMGALKGDNVEDAKEALRAAIDACKMESYEDEDEDEG